MTTEEQLLEKIKKQRRKAAESVAITAQKIMTEFSDGIDEFLDDQNAVECEGAVCSIREKVQENRKRVISRE